MKEKPCVSRALWRIFRSMPDTHRFRTAAEKPADSIISANWPASYIANVENLQGIPELVSVKGVGNIELTSLCSAHG